jgi:hypothetical protein
MAQEAKTDKFKLKALLPSFVIEIDGGINIGGKKVEKIEMREPTLRDIKLVNHIEDELENNATLVGNLTGYTADEILSLPIHISQVLIEGLESFQSSQEKTS